MPTIYSQELPTIRSISGRLAYRTNPRLDDPNKPIAWRITCDACHDTWQYRTRDSATVAWGLHADWHTSGSDASFTTWELQRSTDARPACVVCGQQFTPSQWADRHVVDTTNVHDVCCPMCTTRPTSPAL